MSVDLSCYSSDSVENINKILASLRAQDPELFDSQYLVYDARVANTIHKDIAAEYQFNANSTFLVSLNDKNTANTVRFVADRLKQALGRDRLLVLLTNETVI